MAGMLIFSGGPSGTTTSGEFLHNNGAVVGQQYRSELLAALLAVIADHQVEECRFRDRGEFCKQPIGGTALGAVDIMG